MTEQLDFWSPIESIEPGGTIKERFERFHARNPHVYAALVTIARRMVKAGRTRIGIKQLYEVLRADRLIYCSSDDAFKLDNNYTAYYAREIMANESDLEGLFETRKIRAA